MQANQPTDYTCHHSFWFSLTPPKHVIFFPTLGVAPEVETKNGDVLGLEIVKINTGGTRIKIANVAEAETEIENGEKEAEVGTRTVAVAGGIAEAKAKNAGGQDRGQGIAARVVGHREGHLLGLAGALGSDLEKVEGLEADLAGNRLKKGHPRRMLILPQKKGMPEQSLSCNYHNEFVPEMSRNSFLLLVKSKT